MTLSFSMIFSSQRSPYHYSYNSNGRFFLPFRILPLWTLYAPHRYSALLQHPGRGQLSLFASFRRPLIRVFLNLLNFSEKPADLPSSTSTGSLLNSGQGLPLFQHPSPFPDAILFFPRAIRYPGERSLAARTGLFFPEESPRRE